MEHATTHAPGELTSVLVVGGSIVGLAAAMFLAARDVPTIMVERHRSSALHPRATGFYPRTLETFRSVDLDVSLSGAKTGDRPRRRRVESLAGKWFDEQEWTPKKDGGPKKQESSDFSMYKAVGIAQDRLEPLLRQRAGDLGADLRLGTTMLSFSETADGVIAQLRSPEGELYSVNADYLVAADGAESPVREKLGIPRTGVGHLQILRSVLFTAPLDEYLESGASQFSIDQPDFQAFLSTYSDGRWILMFSDDEERDEQELLKRIHQAIGPREIEVEIITTGRWQLSGLIADRYSDGRVFLAGDAAHTLPPNRGGFGANTGIEDAHNLAWKLAAVLAGESTPELLETYNAERQPIGVLRHDQIFSREDINIAVDVKLPKVELIDDAAMELGSSTAQARSSAPDPNCPPRGSRTSGRASRERARRTCGSRSTANGSRRSTCSPTNGPS